MFKNKFIIGAIIIIAAVSTLAFGWTSVARSKELQSSLNDNLTSFDAAEVSAYRWNAMAKFYEAQSNPNGDLTSFDAADASAYRWEAMGKYYLPAPATHQQILPAREMTSPKAAETSDYRFVPVEPGFWARQATAISD